MRSVTAPLQVKIRVGETPALWEASEALLNTLSGDDPEF